ncbi:hypothetical protein FA95DRAFT_1572815 [Auriscalpium vulgare]|uniref:Uncharacterized protein n=1 Tax=Auriscalpium vulgare TaxID=40419 RepID=A0ACB8RSR1_9AGAM|nr:hypothetical protein FA95DRAFT_1572815 [Auriscalpium vulgare]
MSHPKSVAQSNGLSDSCCFTPPPPKDAGIDAQGYLLLPSPSRTAVPCIKCRDVDVSPGDGRGPDLISSDLPPRWALSNLPTTIPFIDRLDLPPEYDGLQPCDVQIPQLDLALTCATHALPIYPPPLTGRGLTKIFPHPSNNVSRSTSSFFHRQERQFFAKPGNEIIRVRAELDFPPPPRTRARPMGEQRGGYTLPELVWPQQSVKACVRDAAAGVPAPSVQRQPHGGTIAFRTRSSR